MTDYTPKTFKLDNEIVSELEQTAKREDRTMTAIVERALREYMAKSKLEAFQRGEAQPEQASA